MSLVEFIINGGLCGLAEGFDHRKEGHPYNFDNLHKTLGGVTKCAEAISTTAGKLRLNG